MINIRPAQQADGIQVSDFVCKLLGELSGEPVQHPEHYTEASSFLLTKSTSYTVFLAFTGTDNCVGMISLAVSYAVYTQGKFGIIQELYVEPEYRSKDIGRRLLQIAVEYAREKRWSRLEVSTPNADQWQRTIDFYRRQGFEGNGLKLKLKL